jgi:4-hydroxy-2-oxoheptanedioate aldolase
MTTITNTFKQALAAGQPQIGLWLGLANDYTAEVCAGAGFDWLLIDGEHAPNTLDSILRQLQVLAAYPSAPVVRPSTNDPVQIKQILELGAQNLLVPMIESAEEARRAVAAVRYPPAGMRGMGSPLGRSSRWSRVPDYVGQADAQMCLLLQVESVAGVQALDEILAVDGVDGVFIGPADLAASMGYHGDTDHPEVQRTIDDLIVRIARAGRAPGILHGNPKYAQHYLDLGATFVAVGVDAGLLARATENLAAQFKTAVPRAKSGTGGPY